MIYLGIDPGYTGALAVLSGRSAQVFDWPGDEREMARVLQEQLEALDIIAENYCAAIEVQHAFPGQGVTSMFKLGQNYGAWLGILAALQVPTVLVRPQVWRKGLLPPKADKSASLAVARRLYPQVDLKLKKHHGRADALLIAYWLRWRKGE